MALPRRFLLKLPCFLNNTYLEAGTVIFWDPDKANNAMVQCDAKGRPLERRVAQEVEPVHVVDIEPEEEVPEQHALTGDQRATAVLVAVRDVLERDDDADWTKAGEIRIDVIRTMANIEDVTRKEIADAQATLEETEEQAAGTAEAKAKAAAKPE